MWRPNNYGKALIVFLIFLGVCVYYYHKNLPPPPSCEDLGGMYKADSHQCFIVVDKELTHFQAAGYCNSKLKRSFFVASIPSQPHNHYVSDWIRTNYPHIRHYYIGVTVDSTTPQGFSNEDESEMRYWPEGFKLKDHYCTMVDARTEEWHEVSCDKKLHFVCATKPIKNFQPTVDSIVEAKFDQRPQSSEF